MSVNEPKPKPKKQKMICVCCDFTVILEADSEEHWTRNCHHCPECGCVLNLATQTTEHWHGP